MCTRDRDTSQTRYVIVPVDETGGKDSCLPMTLQVIVWSYVIGSVEYAKNLSPAYEPDVGVDLTQLMPDAVGVITPKLNTTLSSADLNAAGPASQLQHR